MDVVQTTSTRTSPAPSTASADSPAITSDFQTFLTMLTAQMQNQDPLNPIDSTDFATQLATFSGVEQQVRTNDLLASLQSQMALMGLGQLGGWIGMEARADMPVAFTGQPVTLIVDPNTGADRTELVVRDDAGTVVQRQGIPSTGGPYSWTGIGADGIPLPDGTYSLTTLSQTDDQPQPERPVQTFALVTEAALRDGETWLTMAGGTSVAASAVQGIRNP